MYLSKLRGVNTNTLFQSVYVFLISIIGATFWSLSTIFSLPSIIGLGIIASVTICALFLFNDFKYVIPGAITFLFTNNDGFKNDQMPIGITIIGLIFLFSLIIYLIINRKSLTFKGKTKSFYALVYFAFMPLIPLIWNNVITKEVFTLYIVYLLPLLYLIIYIIFLLALKQDSFFVVTKSMQYMCVILASECIVKVLIAKQQDPSINVLSLWYYMGWGLCNEAGIMLCMGLPFVFVDAFRFKKPMQFVILYIKLLLIGFGMLLTTSRGTYLFGSIEAITLSIYFVAYHKKRLHALLTIICVISAFLLTFQLTVGISKIADDIQKYVFTNGISSNGRISLWQRAFELWHKSGQSLFFGNGFVCELSYVATHYGTQLGYWVYHSTFFETLAVYGGVGIIALGYHFFEKYRLVCSKFKKPTIVLMLVGFIFVDFYGMIDNTMFMYYYMIPLVIIMASVDNYPGMIKNEKIN